MAKGDLEIDGMLIAFLVLAGLVGAVVVDMGSETADDVLDLSIQKLNAQFYSETPQGNYDMSTYKWTLSGLDRPLDEMPYGTELTAPAYTVLFNGRFPVDLRAVGIRVFERTDKMVPYNVKVAAVLLGDRDSIAPEWGVDDNSFNMSFYDYQDQRNKLELCTVYDKGHGATGSGTEYTVFYIHCNVMWKD